MLQICTLHCLYFKYSISHSIVFQSITVLFLSIPYFFFVLNFFSLHETQGVYFEDKQRQWWLGFLFDNFTKITNDAIGSRFQENEIFVEKFGLFLRLREYIGHRYNVSEHVEIWAPFNGVRDTD